MVSFYKGKAHYEGQSCKKCIHARFTRNRKENYCKITKRFGKPRRGSFCKHFEGIKYQKKSKSL